jgi:urease accessory protein UreF
MTLKETALASSEIMDLLGDLHPLVEQLGSTEGLVSLELASASLQIAPVADRDGLRCFLEHYRRQLLVPVELPAIRRAFFHGSLNQTRELLALDQELAGLPVLREFASASQRVGRSQLRRLRPLRDQRLIRRYLQAVDEEQAHGWHTLVYGLTLSVYSLPLRQGLLGYARQTLRGFIHTAARPLGLSELESRQLLDDLSQDLPAIVEADLRASKQAVHCGAQDA